MPRIFITIIIAITASSCIGHKTDSTDINQTAITQETIAIWDELITSGQQDSLISYTKPIFNTALANNDTVSAIYSGLHIAESYMMIEQLDSFKRYINIISPLKRDSLGPATESLWNNIMGIYELKINLNYPEALDLFKKAYEIACTINDKDKQIVLLANMVYIFYIKQNIQGLEYAEKAYELAIKDTSSYEKCLTEMLMAQMLFVCGQYDSSEVHIQRAAPMARSHGFASLYLPISLVAGDLNYQRSDFRAADSCYSEALQYSEYSTPGTISRIFCNYSKSLLSQRLYQEAADICIKGLDLSYLHNNVSNRLELLRTMARISFAEGDLQKSLSYYRQYDNTMSDSLDKSRENELYRLLSSYRTMEHNLELQQKEVQILRAEKRTYLVSGISVLLIILCISIWLVYKKKNNMYRILVQHHQDYLKRAESLRETKKDVRSDNGGIPEKELFIKIEQVMSDEKLYRRKDISLDLLSEIMESNRTYISKAINNCSGLSFYRYLSTKRIDDAIKMMKDPDIPLKQIADELGFSSVAVFYKVFLKETGCTASRYRKEILNKADRL